jgi:hypothetical protein
MPDQAQHFLRGMFEHFELLWPRMNEIAHQRGQDLLEAHRRVRTASRARNVSFHVVPQTPPDVLGVYIYLPANPS